MQHFFARGDHHQSIRHRGGHSVCFTEEHQGGRCRRKLIIDNDRCRVMDIENIDRRVSRCGGGDGGRRWGAMMFIAVVICWTNRH